MVLSSPILKFLRHSFRLRNDSRRPFSLLGPMRLQIIYIYIYIYESIFIKGARSLFFKTIMLNNFCFLIEKAL